MYGVVLSISPHSWPMSLYSTSCMHGPPPIPLSPLRAGAPQAQHPSSNLDPGSLDARGKNTSCMTLKMTKWTGAFFFFFFCPPVFLFLFFIFYNLNSIIYYFFQLDWIPRTSPGSMCQFPLPLHLRSSAANKNPPMDVLLFSLSWYFSSRFCLKSLSSSSGSFFLSSLFPLPSSSSLLLPPLHRTEEALLQSLTFVLTFFLFLFSSLQTI